MMLRYKYRWVFAINSVFIILVLGFFYDIKPMLTQLNKQCVIRKELEQHITMLKRFTKLHPKAQINLDAETLSQTLSFSEEESVNALLELIRQNDLFLQSMVMLPSDSVNAFLLHAQIKGDFQQLSKLVFALPKKPHMAVIKDFILKENENSILFEVDMLLYKTRIASAAYKTDESVNNPFCHQNIFYQRDVLDEVLRWPLKQIKVKGLLRQGKVSEAWIMLPNQLFGNIHVGSIVGKEHAKVIAIQQEGVLFRLPNNTMQIIKI